MQKCKIRGQRDRGVGHVIYVYVLGPPLCFSGTAEDMAFKFSVWIDC